MKAIKKIILFVEQRALVLAGFAGSGRYPLERAEQGWMAGQGMESMERNPPTLVVPRGEPTWTNQKFGRIAFINNSVEWGTLANVPAPFGVHLDPYRAANGSRT